MATDWGKVKAEFVHGTESMRALAERLGINSAGLMRRAAKEGWEHERKTQSAEVSKAVSAAYFADRAEELARYNMEDLAAAKRLRERALAMLDRTNNPQHLRALSGAIESASKVARLALGVATENATVSHKELPASVDDFV